MKVLLAAPFPPAPDEAATAALRRAQLLLAEGHQVEVISPLPSAAGHHGPLAGLAGAMLLARMARRFDALHLQVSRRILFRPELPKSRRVIDSVALALALRSWRHTSADLGDLSDVPGGGGGLSGRLIWSCFDEIFVSDDLVANHAVKVLGFPAAKVKVRPAPGAKGSTPGSQSPGGIVAQRLDGPCAAPPALPAWQLTGPADWDGIVKQVRDRASMERQRLLRPSRGVAGGADHLGQNLEE